MTDTACFEATARLVVPDAAHLVDRLAAYFAEHCSVFRMENRCRIETIYGVAELEHAGDALQLSARGGDATDLAYVKLSIAEHLTAFTAPNTPQIRWRGDGEAGAPLPYFREMTVAGVAEVTPRMRRITLRGNDLARFGRGGHHVRLVLPVSRGERNWPVTGADGRPQWPQGAARPAVRIYTIRNIRVAAGEVDIDMVLHAGHSGPGSQFASQACEGDVIGMMGPGGASFAPAASYVVAGDETALPAIARMLEELPPAATGTVFIEVQDRGERQALPRHPGMRIEWLYRHDAAAGSTTLLEDAVLAARRGPGEPAFVWVGCEHRTVRRLKKAVTAEWGLTPQDHLLVSYWRQGRAAS